MARSDRDTGTAVGERDPGFLTDEELAGQLDADAEVIRLLAVAGVLPGQRLGGRWLFRPVPVAAHIAERGIRIGDYLTAERLAAPDKLDLDVQTVRDLAAGGAFGDAAVRAAHRWVFSWPAVYVLIAGPGVPLGEVLSAKQLARRFGVPLRAIQRAAGPPGTPGKLPGYRIGKQWRFALEAVRLYLATPEAPGESHPAAVPGRGRPGGSPG